MTRWLSRLASLAPALALLLCLPGCGGRSDTTVTLRFWNGFTGPDGRTMLRMVKRFNEQNPDVHVVMQRMDWDTYYNKLFVAGLGHRAPEVFVIHTHAMDRFQRAGFVRPIDDLMAGPNGMDANDFYPNVWAGDEFGGRHYGLPLDVHCLGMYYNRAMFRKAGIVDASGQAKPPTTRAEFVDAAHRMTASKAGQWGYVFTWLRTNTYTVMKQYGGEFFTPDASRCIMNNPQNVAALQFCADLIQKEHVAPSPENFDAWIGFRQGRVGMAFEGVYMLADVKKQTDLDYAGAPVPLLGTKPAAWASSHNLCIRSDLSGKKLEAAWRFMKFLSDNSLDWVEGGQIPVRKSLRETARFQSMPLQSQFAKQIPYVAYFPRIPFIFEFLREFDTAVEKALRGTDTPQHALDVATANVNAIIARNRAAEAMARRKS